MLYKISVRFLLYFCGVRSSSFTKYITRFHYFCIFRPQKITGGPAAVAASWLSLVHSTWNLPIYLRSLEIPNTWNWWKKSARLFLLPREMANCIQTISTQGLESGVKTITLVIQFERKL